MARFQNRKICENQETRHFHHLRCIGIFTVNRYEQKSIALPHANEFISSILCVCLDGK